MGENPPGRSLTRSVTSSSDSDARVAVWVRVGLLSGRTGRGVAVASRVAVASGVSVIVRVAVGVGAVLRAKLIGALHASAVRLPIINTTEMMRFMPLHSECF